MSTERIYEAAIGEILRRFPGPGTPLDHLDIGSGSGELVRLLKERIPTRARCCDYTDRLMCLPGQPVDIVDLNEASRLPYQNASFDVVTATEVIEHLEDFRKLFREICRVLRPGGVLTVTTPNVLSINSRLRNLWFGFAELMGPLHLEGGAKETCFGHISPVSLFYIVHALHATGFGEIAVSVDRYQRSGMAKLLLLWLPLRVMVRVIGRRERVKYKTINESNQSLVRRINSLPLLLGRTVVVSAEKEMTAVRAGASTP